MWPSNRLSSFLLFGEILTAAAGPLTCRSDSATVDLGYATYQGSRLESAGVDQYLGMRYAKAPLGNLRFRAPQDPDQETSVQDATKFGPICVGTSQNVTDGIAEDCLFVNVFKPSDATEKSNLPVWVYIQGGGYQLNSNANYNGTEVVRASQSGLVLVNFNYRVGALGFLASEKVREDGDLNAGLLDQRKVLHWVQKNIKKFGGNPDHVVIHGASAGGGSVSYHLTAYGAAKDNKLFVGAVPESPFWPTQRTVAELEFQFERLLTNTSCANITCLREVPIAQFMTATPVSPFPGTDGNPLWYWLPVIDQDLVVDRMYKLFESEKFIRVPLMVGDDTDEGSVFSPNVSTAAQVSTFLKNNYPNLSACDLHAINGRYPLMSPLPHHNAYFPSASAAYGEATFICAGNTMASAMAKSLDPAKVWNYRYDVLDPTNVAEGVGVPHTFESSAIFGPGQAGNPAASSYYTTNAAIVPVTMNYYISFVMTLDPNAKKDAGAPTWQPWGSGSGQRLVLRTGAVEMEAVPQNLTDNCVFWNSLSDNTNQ